MTRPTPSNGPSAAPAASLPARPARRLRTPSWRDARLLAGVALVVLATVLGSVVVATARATTAVLTVTRAVPAGQPIGAGDLAVADVRLGSLAGHYVLASERPAAGVVASRDLRAGDLLPVDAVASGDQVSRRRVVVPVRTADAAGLVTGSVVEIWVSDRSLRAGTESFAAPRLVLGGAVVADPTVGRESMSGADHASVSVWVPRDAVAGLLGAVDKKSAITLVPQPGSPVQDAS